ncbi:MAG: Flp pilus assembly complex ATPase component TadA [Ruminococcus flavefaciens]|nr:Flp pilus assembly complex ATPase component TadA [Ruminococcus flavefaciens]MCM1229733.1 Flp pilus assembly complex ATPase component TadA [Ruminococcus flavefaciens]
MQECTSYKIIADYLPEKIRRAMLNVGRNEQEKISEIRLFSGRAVAYIYPDKVLYLTACGLTASFRNTAVVVADSADISQIVDSLSHYSLHSCSRELKQGFFVLKNGVRVGISGMYSANGVITEATGLNFRMARNVVGSADKIFNLIADGSSGVLICGSVNSGKTTVLRDLCRIVGNRKKVTLVDERNEIAYVHNGTAENDVGTLTNILVGCSRADGIISAVRTLSPDYIFCDEISTDGDSEAIICGIGCGVKFCATIHAENYEDLMKRRVAEKIIGAFGYAVFLQGAENPGEIAEIRRI